MNNKMHYKRSAGILLHPTSLPGRFGIGTFGKAAFDFIDFLERSRVSLWQVLPLGPTGYGDSPYQSFSTFALNPLLIDLEDLVKRGWATDKLIEPADYIKQAGPVDYGSVVWWKMPILRECADYFLLDALDEAIERYHKFCRTQKFWLDDFSVFMSIKSSYDLQAASETSRTKKAVSSTWNTYWDPLLARHDEAALKKWKKAHKDDIELIKVIQFFAYEQWSAVRAYAASKKISIVGDIPIFVSPDSADVWAHQDLFQLDKNGVPKKVAGVPPDYFSQTGQLWGNPLYDWAAMKKDDYAWWISRIKHLRTIYDIIRIDHFRGFESYWAIPYGNENAIKGSWLKGPGMDLFDAIRKSLGDLPLIAEDLGIITDEVRALRDESGLPGMKVLQFAFDTSEAADGHLVNAFLPHTYDKNCIVYTGTHDNDTTQGWLSSLPVEQCMLVASYLKGRLVSANESASLVADGELCRLLVKEAFSSVADLAVIPFQDVYAIGNEGRMNTPSTSGANWAWRMDSSMLTGPKAEMAASGLAELALLYDRIGK